MTSDFGYLRRVWVLMATVFVDMIGFLIILPLLPFYGEELGAAEWEVGVLISAFAFAQLATAPLWGKASDRYGRRPIILVSLAVAAVAFVVFGLARTVWMLLASRLVQGAGGGTVGVVQAYVSDSVPPKARTQVLGWVTVASSAGVMLGPVLGSLAVELGDEWPGFIAAGLCLVNLVFAYFYLPEPIRAKHADGAEVGSVRRALGQVLRHPATPMATLVWIYTLGMMAFMAMGGVVALYLERAFGVTKATIGYFYTYMGAVSVVMRAFLLGPVVRRLGEARTLRLGAFSLLLGLFAMPLPGNVWGFAAVAILVPIGTALLFPATTSLVSQCAPAHLTGQSLGVQQAFGGASRVLGPLWATAAFQYFSHGSPFWMSAGVMGVVVLVSFAVGGGWKGKGGRAEVREAAVAEKAGAVEVGVGS